MKNIMSLCLVVFTILFSACILAKAENQSVKDASNFNLGLFRLYMKCEDQGKVINSNKWNVNSTSFIQNLWDRSMWTCPASIKSSKNEGYYISNMATKNGVIAHKIVYSIYDVSRNAFLNKVIKKFGKPHKVSQLSQSSIGYVYEFRSKKRIGKIPGNRKIKITVKYYGQSHSQDYTIGSIEIADLDLYALVNKQFKEVKKNKATKRLDKKMKENANSMKF